VLWDGGGVTSEWSEPANWQFNALPTTADTAMIRNDTATITGTMVPHVFAVEVGAGSTPGGLTMNGNVNPAGLTAVTSVAVASAGNLTLGGGGPGLSTLMADSLTTAGTTTVLTRGRVNLNGQLTQTAGTLNLTGGVIDAATVVTHAGAFNAAGTIDATVTIGNATGPTSTLEVGPLLTINGNLKLNSDARLAVELRPALGGPVFDRVEVTGTATLGGVLDLSVLGGATPVEGAVYTIVAADGFTGTFDDIIGLPTEEGSWGVGFDDILSGLNVQHSAIRGNMNLDGGVDELDVEMFAWAIRDATTYNEQFVYPLEVLAASPLMADMDGDGVNTFGDIPLFLHQVELAGGSTAAAMATLLSVLDAVPEPGSAALAWSVALFGGHALRRLQRCRRPPP
jgi:hypothetical protein